MQGQRRTPAAPKRKLRTITDVVSRIKWAGNQDEHLYTKDDVVLGYDDRIHGPLETHLNDFVPLSQGGDLPEHRIWYVRCGEVLLWDRLGRVDKLFGSGEGRDAPISPVTRLNVSEARANMERLEEEKRSLRALRERDRARKARQRATRAALLNSYVEKASVGNRQLSPVVSNARFIWKHAIPFVFGDATDGWLRTDDHGLPPSKKLTVVTWNVLFDCYDLTETKQQTQKRWTELINELMTTNADIIALQEATPEFLELLCRHPLVKEQYAASASPKAAESVTPYGNLLLWKRRVFACFGLHVCIDGNRQRAVIGVLSTRGEGAATYIIGNVHLPGNKGDALRGDARRRELSAVLGKVQRLVSTSHRDGIPILAGDFNDHEDLVSFSTKMDMWEAVHDEDGDSGFTFDPRSNPRAAFTRQQTGSSRAEEPKRIDRIISLRNGVAPITAELIGKNQPPSDHYGVVIELDASRGDILKTKINSDENLWGGSALATPDTLLGLTLDKYPLLPDDVPTRNKTSSLPIPHVTLLHGFVEIQSSMDLVKAAVEDSIRSAGLVNALPLTLDFDQVDVFEHSASATLVCRPRDCDWLRTLYNTLRATFPQCHEQETRFAEGWTPHVSLGSFGTSSAAREFISNLNLRTGTTEALTVEAITIFRRSPVDGEFFAAGVVPIRGQSMTPTTVLKEAGRSQHEAFEGVARVLRFELERACEATAGSDKSATVHIFGSHALQASMRGFSDIDAVVEVTSNDRNPASLSFLRGVSGFLQARHPAGKFRIRQAKSNETTRLSILTCRLWPGAPALDLQVAFRNQGTVGFTDDASRLAFGGVMDTLKLQESVQEDQRGAFSGALRILKFWAHQRGVYGFGFLGGGGWGTWLSHVMKGWDGPDCGADSSEAARQLVAYFFQKAATYGPSIPIVVTPPKSAEAEEELRGSPLVLLPYHTETNFGRSATKSTTLALLDEVSKAACALDKAGLVALKDVTKELTPRRSSCGSVLEIGVVLSSERNPGTPVADVKSHANQIILYAVVDLEHRLGDPSRVRPFLKPARTGGKFVWVMLLRATEQDLGDDWINRKRDDMQASLATYGATVSVQLIAKP